jgi:hypothetical protein
MVVVKTGGERERGGGEREMEKARERGGCVEVGGNEERWRHNYRGETGRQNERQRREEMRERE